MKIKGQFFLITTVLIILTVFSGCTKKEEAAAGPEAKTLTYWSMWNESETQALVLKEAIKEYESLNPGVKVDIQWNGREIRKTLQPGLDAGTKIDMWDEGVELLTKSFQSYALNLDPYFEKSYPSTNGKAFKETIIGSLQGLASDLSTDGSIYAVPYQPFVVVSFYNKDHFDKAGISGVPETWAEFLEVCAKLKAAGFTPVTIDDAYMDLPLGMHLNRVFGDSKMVEALVQDRTGKLWDDPRVLQAAKDFEALAPFMSPQTEGNKWPAGQQEVATDQVSIYITNGTWLPNEVMATTGPDFKWGQFAYPAATNGVSVTGGIFGAQGFSINKECAYPDEAFALVAHLTTGKWDKELSAKTYGAPMDTSIAWPVQIEECETVFASLDTYIPWSGGLAIDPDGFPIVVAEFTSLIAGKITAGQFITNVKANLK